MNRNSNTTWKRMYYVRGHTSFYFEDDYDIPDNIFETIRESYENDSIRNTSEEQVMNLNLISYHN